MANSARSKRTRCDRDRGIVPLLRWLSLIIAQSRNTEEVLATILDACSEELNYLYPSVALLNVSGSRLVGRLISSSDTWERVRQVTRGVGVPLDGFLGLRGERRATRRAGQPGEVPPDALCYQLETTENLVVQVFLDGTPAITTSLYDLLCPQLEAEAAAAVQQALGITSIAVLPLTARGRRVGVLTVASDSEQSVGAFDIPALEILAGQAAMVIENSRLYQELLSREQQVSALLKVTIDAQEEERERICLEIHDRVAQTLAPAFQYLQTLDSRPELPDALRANVRKASMLVRNAIREAREVIASLRPAALDTLGLVATLRHEIDDLRTQMGWQVDFEADEVRFPKAVETALYRILHEALSNVTKHAHANRVTVRVKQEQARAVAVIQDNGVGFDVQAWERQLWRKSVGLLSMRKRAELLQGSFDVMSSPGEGTVVRVEVPLLAQENPQDDSSDQVR